MPPKVRAQTHMEDVIVEDAELERILEERQELKQSVAGFRASDKKAKDKIRSIETPTPYRVGRFVITKATVAAKSVNFETAEGFRFTIKPVDEE